MKFKLYLASVLAVFGLESAEYQKAYARKGMGGHTRYRKPPTKGAFGSVSKIKRAEREEMRKAAVK